MIYIIQVTWQRIRQNEETEEYFQIKKQDKILKKNNTDHNGEKGKLPDREQSKCKDAHWIQEKMNTVTISTKKEKRYQS